MRTKMTKIIASLMAIVLITSVFTACGDNNNDETTTTTNPSTVQSDATTDVGENTTEPISENASSEDTPSDDITDPSSEGTTKEGDPTTPNSTTKPDGTTRPTSNNPTNPTKPAPIKTPSTKAEIIKYYKEAAAKVNSEKAGYYKSRSSFADEFDVPLLFKPFTSLIEFFMGLGKKNEYKVTVAKGEIGGMVRPDAGGTEKMHYYLQTVTLSESDVERAKCEKVGNNYVITLEIKDGKSAAGYGITTVNKSALDRCGLCVGDRDLDFFDHKTGEVMYSAIQGTFKDTKIYEETDDCILVATINASTGNMVNIKVTFDLECEMSVKSVKLEASGSTIVKYENFKW